MFDNERENIRAITRFNADQRRKAALQKDSKSPLQVVDELVRSHGDRVYDEKQKIYSFHKDYWVWEQDERGYLVVSRR